MRQNGVSILAALALWSNFKTQHSPCTPLQRPIALRLVTGRRGELCRPTLSVVKYTLPSLVENSLSCLIGGLTDVSRVYLPLVRQYLDPNAEGVLIPSGKPIAFLAQQVEDGVFLAVVPRSSVANLMPRIYRADGIQLELPEVFPYPRQHDWIVAAGAGLAAAGSPMCAVTPPAGHHPHPADAGSSGRPPVRQAPSVSTSTCGGWACWAWTGRPCPARRG